MLAVALELRGRGHDVTVLAGAWQGRSVGDVGLAFHPVLAEAHFQGFNSGTWEAFFSHLVMPAIDPVYTYVSERVVRGETLLIGASHVIGLRLVEEKYGVPLVTTRLQPKPSGAHEATELQLAAFNGHFAPLLNHYRRRIGLAAITQPFDTWLVSLERAVAFFPPWFPDPRVDAAEQGRMVDFVFFDPAVDTGSNRQLDAFLAGHDLPIVFTYGTGNDSVGEFFSVAAQACINLGKPAIFLARHLGKRPPTLPRHILHVDYFPLNRLLGYVDAIVYHGGIGTCAQALKGGIAHLVIPVGFDQHQNAQRVEYLGVGAHLSSDDFTAENVTRGLADLLHSTSVRNRCRELCQRFGADDGIQRCCDEIEALAML
jgi:rhamnosyltransferase subunit B